MIEDYKHLPIGKYQEILKVSQDESLEEIDKQVKILSILSDLEEDEILNLPIMDYKDMATKSRFLENPVIKDLRVAKEYKIGDWDLMPVSDHRKITTAQYIDFKEYSKQGEDKLVEVLSCLLVPKGHKYNVDYDVVELQGAIRENMSVADVVSLVSFFLNAWRELILSSLISSKQEAMRIPELERREMMLHQINEQLELLKTSGDGLRM